MDRRRVGKALFLLGAVACLVWTLPATALDTNVRIVRFSFSSGDVQLDRGQGFGRAILNTPIVQGSRLTTRGDDALAEVEFEDGSTMRLTPGTTIEFWQLSLRASGEKVSSITLENGTAYFDIHSGLGEFRVSSGGQEITVPRAARSRVLGDNGELKVAVYHGDVNVRNGDKLVDVRGGETFSLELSDPSHYSLARSIAEGSYDDWNHERQNYAQTYTSASTYGSAPYSGSFSPAYSYGLADLAYYGNYFYVPAWGWAWQPYYAGVGWNPFFDGAWMWYPQFGYAWVSPYPWGWMPYRYGSWNFIPGYGWAWMPGAAWNTWMTVPMVSHAPVNWVALHAPAAPVAGAPSTVAVGRVWGPVYPAGVQAPLLQRTLLASSGASAAPHLWRFTGQRANFMANHGTVSGPSRVAMAKPQSHMAHSAPGPRPSGFPDGRGASPGSGGHAGSFAGAGHGGHR